MVSKFPNTNGSKASNYNFELSNNDNTTNILTNIKSGVHYDDNGGSASRFFYTAKASQTERNWGMFGLEFDSIEIILYNVNKGDDIIWKEKITTNEVQKAQHQENMVISLKKVIEEYGIQEKKDTVLNMLSYGKKTLEKYLTDTKYTTKMKINSTTIQTTLKWLHHFIINEYIADANYELTDGGNNVTNVENGSMLEIIIKEKTEYQAHANPVQLRFQLKINEKEKRNNHVTVKPLDLMRYLVRLVTPKNGICLDPYMGSGTTAIACKSEKINYVGCELDEQYIKIAEARIKAEVVVYDIFDFTI